MKGLLLLTNSLNIMSNKRLQKFTQTWFNTITIAFKFQDRLMQELSYCWDGSTMLCKSNFGFGKGYVYLSLTHFLINFWEYHDLILLKTRLFWLHCRTHCESIPTICGPQMSYTAISKTTQNNHHYACKVNSISRSLILVCRSVSLIAPLASGVAGLNASFSSYGGHIEHLM